MLLLSGFKTKVSESFILIFAFEGYSSEIKLLSPSRSCLLGLRLLPNADLVGLDANKGEYSAHLFVLKSSIFFQASL